MRSVVSVGGANRCSFVNRINLFHAFAVMPSINVCLPCLCEAKKLLRIQNMDSLSKGAARKRFYPVKPAPVRFGKTRLVMSSRTRLKKKR